MTDTITLAQACAVIERELRARGLERVTLALPVDASQVAVAVVCTAADARARTWTEAGRGEDLAEAVADALRAGRLRGGER